MDFLTTALYSQSSQAEESLAGVLLTRFDEQQFAKRPYVYYASVEELRTGQGGQGPIAPRGFKLDENGILLSDTTCRSVFSGEVASYIEKEVTDREKMPIGLIDLVLDCVELDARIIPNFNRLGKEDEAPIMVPFKNLRVSKSSFNIYTPYRNQDDKFRTLSLLDVTVDETNPFTIAVPRGSKEFEMKYSGKIEQIAAPCSAEWIVDYNFYQVSLPLLPAYYFMGEAFVHYLAYNVAYYTMGERVIDAFLEDSKFKAEPTVEEEVEEQRVRRYPKYNVRIEHAFKDLYLEQLLKALGNRDALLHLLTERPEANITLEWVQSVFNNRPAGDNWDGDAMCQSCVQLKYSCRTQLLRYSLELLAQRYYVQKVGFLEDTLPDILKGGGVGGSAIKRVTW